MSRRWTLLLPVIFVTYSLAYLDRANFSFGAAAGMAADLHISASQSSLLGALFFLGYFAFQIPGAIYAQNRSVKKLIFAGLIGWGVLAASLGLISDINLLYVTRFLLGVVESAVLPALLILQARFYTRGERARANALLVMGNPATLLWMSVLSGYLASTFGWRIMFVLEGLPPIIWAFVWWRLVADHPAETKWLSPEDRAVLESRLAAEQGGIAELELLRTFNCGIGMIAIVKPDAIEQVSAILTDAGETVALLGEVIPTAGEHRVVYNGHLDLSR